MTAPGIFSSVGYLESGTDLGLAHLDVLAQEKPQSKYSFKNGGTGGEACPYTARAIWLGFYIESLQSVCLVWLSLFIQCLTSRLFFALYGCSAVAPLMILLFLARFLQDCCHLVD